MELYPQLYTTLLLLLAYSDLQLTYLILWTFYCVYKHLSNLLKNSTSSLHLIKKSI